MKKLFYLLIALPMLLVAACDNDDDYPDVKVGVSYEGATSVDGTLYCVQGDTLTVDSVFVTPVNTNSRATIGSVTYVFDGRPLGIAPTPPYAISILTEPIPTGTYDLRLQMSVFENGRTPGIAYCTIPVTIVESESDIPTGDTGTPGRYIINPEVKDK